MSNSTFSSSSWNQKESKLQKAPPKNSGKTKNGDNGSNQVYTSSDAFEVKGIGSLLLKQDYSMLFYANEKLGITISSATVSFQDKNKNTLVELRIENNKITLNRYYNSESIDSKLQPIEQNFTDKMTQPLFPSTENAPIVLFRNIWIQVNQLINQVKICYGDVSNTANTLFRYNFQNDLGVFHDTNQSSVVQFPMPTNSASNKDRYNPRVKNILAEACYYSVKVETFEKSTEQSFDDFFQIRFMTNVQVYGPHMEKNPSFMTRSAPLGNMPEQIQGLYSYLQTSSLSRLPNFPADSPNLKILRQEYLNWHDFPFAVQQSLLTPPGYHPAFPGQTTRVPYGVINHLYEWKIKKAYKIIDSTQYNNKDEMMKDIYLNRQGYIRLQLTDHEGKCPGGMAIIQVWPPYNCSMVHNHGNSYGLIKVQSGILQVQNFNELNFEKNGGIQNPFLSTTYQEGDYFWLSQYSYGIHRLMNLRPQTCMTIQAYYRGKDTNQYFSFIEKKQDINNVNLKSVDGPVFKNDSLLEFYPQNDWINYINSVNNDQLWIQKYLQDEKEGKNPDDPKTSRWAQHSTFINNIIDRYQLPYIIVDKKRLNRQKFKTRTIQSKDPVEYIEGQTKIYKPTFYQLALILKESYDFAQKWGQDSPSWVTSDNKFVACILENDHNQNTEDLIKQLRNNNIQVVQYKDLNSFKVDAQKYSQRLKKEKKQIAIVDGLQHYQSPQVNRSASSNLFQEVRNTGLDYRIGVSLNKTSKDNAKALINNGLTFEVTDIKQIVEEVVKMTKK